MAIDRRDRDRQIVAITSPAMPLKTSTRLSSKNFPANTARAARAPSKSGQYRTSFNGNSSIVIVRISQIAATNGQPGSIGSSRGAGDAKDAEVGKKTDGTLGRDSDERRANSQQRPTVMLAHGRNSSFDSSTLAKRILSQLNVRVPLNCGCRA